MTCRNVVVKSNIALLLMKRSAGMPGSFARVMTNRSCRWSVAVSGDRESVHHQQRRNCSEPAARERRHCGRRAQPRAISALPEEVYGWQARALQTGHGTRLRRSPA